MTSGLPISHTHATLKSWETACEEVGVCWNPSFGKGVSRGAQLLMGTDVDLQAPVPSTSRVASVSGPGSDSSEVLFGHFLSVVWALVMWLPLPILWSSLGFSEVPDVAHILFFHLNSLF